MAVYYGGQAFISALQNWNPQDIPNPLGNPDVTVESDPVTPLPEATQKTVSDSVETEAPPVVQVSEDAVETPTVQSSDEVPVETQVEEETVTPKTHPKEMPTLVSGTPEAIEAGKGTAVAFLNSASPTSKTFIIFKETQAEALKPIQQWKAAGNMDTTCPAGSDSKSSNCRSYIEHLSAQVEQPQVELNATNTTSAFTPVETTTTIPVNGTKEETTASPETGDGKEAPTSGSEKTGGKEVPPQAGPAPKPENNEKQVTKETNVIVAVAEGVGIVVGGIIGTIYLLGSLNE